MSKPILTRNNLQGMKDTDDNRRRQVSNVVDMIYSNVVQQSKTTTNKSYKFYGNLPGYSKTYFEDNKVDIISGLRLLFPDSIIEFKFFLRDNNEQIKEFSIIDETLRQ
jgi:hypothetical protein